MILQYIYKILQAAAITAWLELKKHKMQLRVVHSLTPTSPQLHDWLHESHHAFKLTMKF